MKFGHTLLLLHVLAVLLCVRAFAAPVSYTGKLAIAGVNYNGAAAFTFALRDQNGTVHWRKARSRECKGRRSRSVSWLLR